MIKYLPILLLSLCSLMTAAEDDNVLQQLFEAARERDDQLLLAQARLEEAKGLTQQALGRMMPQIAVESSVSESQFDDCVGPNCVNAMDSSLSRNSISLNQPIYQPSLQRNYRMKRALSEQAGYEYGVAYLGLFDRLLGQYLDILTESDRVRTIQAQRDTLVEQFKVIESRVDAGVASTIDLAEISASLQQAEANLIQSRISLRVFYEGLSESTGLTIKNLPPIRRDLEMPVLDNQDPTYWKDFALRENLSLLAARKGLQAAIEDRKQNSRNRLPTLNLFSSYSTSNQEFPDTSTEQTETQVGLSLNIPIFSGGSTSGEIKQARARVDQARHQVNLLEIENKVLVPSLVRLINQGDQFIDAARQSMEAAQGSVSQTETLYEAGTRSISELLAAYERRTQTEQSYYTALYNHIRNHADFYIRTAQLDEERLKDFYQIADLTDFDNNRNPLLDED